MLFINQDGLTFDRETVSTVYNMSRQSETVLPLAIQSSLLVVVEIGLGYHMTLDGQYAVTHVASGYKAYHKSFSSAREAERFILAAKDVTDWRLPLEAIRRKKAARISKLLEIAYQRAVNEIDLPEVAV